MHNINLLRYKVALIISISCYRGCLSSVYTVACISVSYKAYSLMSHLEKGIRYMNSTAYLVLSSMLRKNIKVNSKVIPLKMRLKFNFTIEYDILSFSMSFVDVFY